MKYKSSLLAVLIVIFTLFQLNAHEDHDKKKEKPDTVTVVNGDTIAINGIALDDSLLVIQEAIQDEDELIESTEEFGLNAGDALFDHIHNKIVHYPIALALVAFLFAVLGYKDDRYQLVIKIMLLIAGVFAIVAFFSGTNQLDPFIGNPKEWLANTHRLLGIATAILIWIWFLCLSVKSLKKFSMLFAVITVILVSITGLYGGVLSH
ncbi:MAG: hypothetical protein WBG58_07300 [Ignavibacteriaceae bacterium]